MTERDHRLDEEGLVKPQMLGDQIKDRLLTAIMEGELSPGDRIVETRIAKELGISQGPVREALRDLATLGLVDLQPHRGARVRQPTMGEHFEAMRVRVGLEAMAAREACGKITEDQAEELRRLIREMEELAEAGDTHGHAEKNTEFHAVIVRLSGNRTLERVWQMIQPFAQTYRTMTLRGLDDGGEYVDSHGPILEALLAGTPDCAEDAIREHGRLNMELISQAEARRAGEGVDAPV